MYIYKKKSSKKIFFERFNNVSFKFWLCYDLYNS